MSNSDLIFVEPYGIDNISDDDDETAPASPVHIRIKQRTGRKHITTIEGLPNDLDMPLILSAMKKRFNCNGNLVKLETDDSSDDDNPSLIIQLTGDQRERAREFLVSEEIADKNSIYIHGY